MTSKRALVSKGYRGGSRLRDKRVIRSRVSEYRHFWIRKSVRV